MAGRIPIVVGNWKLQNTIGESLALIGELRKQLAPVRDVEIGVAPVATALHAVARQLDASHIGAWGQNCHFAERGAFTGEVSASLLRDAGAIGVIVGHSERRTLFGETDDVLARKVRAALDAGLRVIVCVGESEAERDGGQTEGRVGTQIAAAMGPVTAQDLDRLVVAYEPVWAIGTGRTATPAQAQEVHAFVRRLLGERFGTAAVGVRIQYGGSVKPDNAAELMRQADVDGALVGGASLRAEEFAAIVKAARPRSG